MYGYPLDQIITKRTHRLTPQTLLFNLSNLLQYLKIKFYRENEIQTTLESIQNQENLQRIQEERKLKDREKQMNLKLEREKKLKWIKTTILQLG